MEQNLILDDILNCSIDNNLDAILDDKVAAIYAKIADNQRISVDEGEYLYLNAPLMLLSKIALEIKRKKSGDKVFYNRNFHIEPTNICVFNCRFCSYRQVASSPKAWNMSCKEVVEYALERYNENITEIHLVGGVDPKATLESYGAIIKSLREAIPSVAIKAFSAVEHIYVIEKAGVSCLEGMKYLKECGMDSITGGGAEIFEPTIREQICPDKPNSEKWLSLHAAAHELGIKTASTMLYGHVESVRDRLNHIDALRTAQDKTNGYNVFIPLKFRNKNNSMSHIEESSLIEDLKTIAISRIMFDNVDHIKAYPPSLGVENTPFALMFGADDIDGTVNDTTKIYSMAGVNNERLTESKLREIASSTGFTAIERDTFYNIVSKENF
ncbi:MAG: CofH family radical SAM protein [Rikenellaceae bacterium]